MRNRKISVTILAVVLLEISIFFAACGMVGNGNDIDQYRSDQTWGVRGETSYRR